MAFLLSMIGGVIGLATMAFAQNEGSPDYELVKINDEAFYLHVPGVPFADNLGVIMSNNQALMIDTGQMPNAARVMELFEIYGIPSPQHVINTHYHHAGANAAFAEHGVIAAQQKTSARLSVDQMMYGMVPFPAIDPKGFPDVEVEASLVIQVGEIDAIITYLPEAHTDGDLVITVPGADVAFTGDIFVNLLGVTDYASGGTLAGYLDGLDWMLENFERDWTIVPGHGQLATYGDIADFRAHLGEEITLMREKIEAGQTVEEIVEAGPQANWGALA